MAAAGIVTILIFHRNIAAFLAEFGWDDFRASVVSFGPWAPLVCIGLHALFTVLFLPTTLVGILIALLFGPWLGLPISLAGLGLGMAISFLLARYLLRGWIEQRLGHKPFFLHISGHVNREGWKLIMFTRMLPVHPFQFMNYACGLTRIPFRVFLASSVVGVIPNTVALLWTTHAAGQLAAGQRDWRVMALLSAGALLFALLAWLPRLLRRKLPSAFPESDGDMLPDE